MRRRLVPAALLLPLALLLTACGGSPAARSSSDTDGRGSLTLNVGDQKGGSEAVLRAAGELKNLDYRIKWSTFTSGPPLLEAVNAGAVDIGGVGNTPPVFAAGADSKITVVAAWHGTSKGDAILVPEGSPLKEPGQLKGRSVAVAQGSSAHYQLVASLRKAGLGLGDVRVKYLQPADVLAAFTSGQVDAWAVWDPYTSQVLRAKQGRVLTTGEGVTNGLTFQVAAPSALKDRRKAAAIEDYLERLRRADDWVHGHQREWARVWTEETGLPYEVALAAVGRSYASRVPVAVDAPLIASEQEIADTFTALRLIPRKVDFARFADPAFNGSLPPSTTAPRTSWGGKIHGLGAVSRSVNNIEVVVIGAGQAGLAGAYHLRRTGFEPERDFVVLDHSPGPGGAWQFRWPSLTYGKVHGMHALPGMELTGADPARPSAEVIAEYFDTYERTFDLRVRRPVDVRAVREGTDGRLLVETSAGVWSTRALINATGTWDRPFWPRYPGQETFRGRQLHTAQYPGPEEFAGLRVVVVGGGASGTQHLLEIAPFAAATTWVTRRPPVFREGPFDEEAGRAAVALVEERVRRGLPPKSVVSVTGLPLNDAVRQGIADGVLDRRPMFDRITPDGVAWDDGRRVDADVILWATGFRAAVDHLAPLRLREPGGGIRVEGTRAVADPRVHLVGYGPSASTIGANRAGRAAVRDIRRLLAGEPVAA